MAQDYGREAPRARHPAELRERARWLVVIDAEGVASALLFDEQRRPLGDFDAGTEEVALMTRGLQPVVGAAGPEWDRALDGHGLAERRAARVYALDV